MTKPTSPFAGLAKLRANPPAPATTAPVAAAAPRTASASPAAAVLAANRTLAPKRQIKQVEYPKVTIRLAEGDPERIQKLIGFVNSHGRRPALSAAARVALRLLKADDAFLKLYDKLEDRAKTGDRPTLGLLPGDVEYLQAGREFLIGNNRRAVDGTIMRCAIHAVPLDDEFLKLYDELKKEESGRRSRSR